MKEDNEKFAQAVAAATVMVKPCPCCGGPAFIEVNTTRTGISINCGVYSRFKATSNAGCGLSNGRWIARDPGAKTWHKVKLSRALAFLENRVKAWNKRS